MNDFTKEELEKIKDGLNYAVGNPYGFTADSIYPLYSKIQAMIDNHCVHDAKWIAKAHLKEAESLIGHAMALLNMSEDNNE